MSFKSRIKDHFAGENWFSHFIMFITTVMGILIALELDQYRSEKSEEKKVDLYRIRLNNELKINKAHVINSKQSLIKAFTIVEISRTYSAMETGEYLVPRQLIDSLMSIDLSFKELITIHREDGDMVFVNFNFSITPTSLAFDTWDATKASNVLQNLRPSEVIQYSNVYKALNTNLGKSAQEFQKRIEDMTADDLLNDAERKEILESLQILIMDAYSKEKVIEQCLRELASSDDFYDLEKLTEPIDSTRLADRVETIMDFN